MMLAMERKLRTEIPGPTSKGLMRRREAAIPRAVFWTAPIFAAPHGGAIVEDVDGNRFIDLVGGIGVLNVGRGNPAVMKAVQEQLENFIHECFHVSMYESYVELAEALNRLTPGEHAKKTMFSTSGAEAVENAVKIARYATGRPAVVGFTHGFHGRTLMALTLTAKNMPYRHGFGPFAPEVYRVPFPYEYRCPFESDTKSCGEAAADYAADFIDSHIGKDNVACVVLEPLLGEGGFIVPPREFVTALREITRQRGILLIADEIQSGMGRTGKLFASEHFDLVPDIVTTAKSLGAGFPISGVTGTAEVMDAPHVGGIGGTYGGNPVACAAALAVITELTENGLLQRAVAQGELIRGRLDPLMDSLGIVGEVRGLGPMVGIELVTDENTKEPAKKEAAAVAERCLANGVLILKAGSYDNVLRLLAPLVITDEQLNEALDVLIEAPEWANGGMG
jgi:4-aminobutyrate aminotransferase / (S)-3-amino-2-methylpropionate transaminase / 5-aminovalerate transaminase